MGLLLLLPSLHPYIPAQRRCPSNAVATNGYRNAAQSPLLLCDHLPHPSPSAQDGWAQSLPSRNRRSRESNVPGNSFGGIWEGHGLRERREACAGHCVCALLSLLRLLYLVTSIWGGDYYCPVRDPKLDLEKCGDFFWAPQIRTGIQAQTIQSEFRTSTWWLWRILEGRLRRVMPRAPGNL